MIEYRLPVCDSFRKMRIQKCPMNCGTNIFIEDRLESEKYIMLHENKGMGSFYIPIDKDDMKHSLNTIPIAGILISIREEEHIVQVDKIYCEIGYEKFIPELTKQIINYADFYGLKVIISLSRRMSVSHHSSLY